MPKLPMRRACRERVLVAQCRRANEGVFFSTARLAIGARSSASAQPIVSRGLKASARAFLFAVGDLERLATHRDEFIDPEARLWGGVDLRAAKQVALLEQLLSHRESFPFPKHPEAGWRYYWDNDYFRFADGFALAALLADYRPARIVEVGSGFTTALMLDISARVGFPTKLTSIEPFPERLLELLRPEDVGSVQIIAQRVQDVPTLLFEELEANDFLFIDSSHVAKAGSDVAEIFLRILPRLRPGVIVHFHDVFYPHVYPEAWLRDGCAWNEGLFLRVFLQFNHAFEVMLFNPFVAIQARDRLAALLSLFLEDTGGSLYLRRVH